MKTITACAALTLFLNYAGAQVAQPDAPATHTQAAPDRPLNDHIFYEAFPPSAVAAPGIPGAMLHPDLPEGYVLIEGDIQVRLPENGPLSTFGPATYWTSTIPFNFHANVTAQNQQRAIDAMDQIALRAGIAFVPRTSQSDFIQFHDSDGNNSPVGRQGGMQTINIASWGNQIVIVHELFHSLGFQHEQTRPDRDQFVTINLANVCQNCCSGGSCSHNFELHSDSSRYGFYDFDSLMHYDGLAFSINSQPTIAVNQPFTAEWQDAIGQRNHFSFFDEVTVRGIYPFGNDRWWKPGASGSHSGNLINPINQSTFAAAYNAAPTGGTLFIKDFADYPAVGTYARSMVIKAPTGARLGN